MPFPETRRSAFVRLHEEDETVRRQSYEAIITAYWPPVHAYLTHRWHETDADADDLTQAFFAKALETGTLVAYDPGKATFRTYLRTCLDRFVINARKQAIRRQTTPLDFDVPGFECSPDELFHREWVRSLFGLAIGDLRAKHDDIRFRVFERYDLNDAEARPTYTDLAAEFGTTTQHITNYLASARRDFRRALLARLRDLTASEREYRSDARAVLGVEV
jgi:RNA polymerase sigma factor (sigma-70 family)